MRKNRRNSHSKATVWGHNLDGEPIFCGLSKPAHLSKTQRWAQAIKQDCDAHESAMYRLKKAKSKIKD